MILATVALVVATLLCLYFDTTRWYGVAGVLLLFAIHPLLSTALLLGGVALCFIHYYRRRTFHELPKLPDRRD